MDSRLGAVGSASPKRTVTEPSSSGTAVTLFTEYCCSVLGNEVPGLVVDADRPEAIDGDVADGQPMGRGTVVVFGEHRHVLGVSFWVAAPSGCCHHEVANGVDLLAGPKRHARPLPRGNP